MHKASKAIMPAANSTEKCTIRTMKRIQRVKPFKPQPYWPYEWNTRPLTEADFDSYCAYSKIIVREIPLDNLPGCYLVCGKQPVIFLDDKLRGYERMFVRMHELGHHLMHPPGERFKRGRKEATEVEADAFAACALIPRPLLTRRRPDKIIEEYGYPASLIELRREILSRWAI